MLEFGILGPLQVRAQGRQLPIGGSKRRALLALLLIRANQAVSTDWLIDELWGGRPPQTAANTLQAHVSQLRRVLHAGLGKRDSAVLVTQPPGYLLRVPAGSLDADRFARLVSDADDAHARGSPGEASALLTEALGLWRGPALADATWLGSARPEIARLEELHRRALEDRIDCELELGRHAEVVAEVEALVAEHPLSERLRRQFMLALYRSGRQADALGTYQDARRALLQELGLEPGPELRELHVAILQHDTSVTAPAVAEQHEALPSFLTAFVGRDNEVDEVAALVGGGARLLTITGLGGIGKTRLAVEAARRLLDDFRDGVAYVELATITDPALVVPTIAQALGETGVADVAVLSNRLRDRQLLLVLDNFEQVLEAAPLLTTLLDCPGPTLLVTSRAVLRVSGENEYPVPSLPIADAVALFADRAVRVNPRFGLADPDAAAVEELCARLEGLPLAIELAAARTRLLTPAAMLDRLASRLDLLTEGPRDAPERHRALRTTLDWSYELLAPRQRRVFAQLGVFVGGCSIEAAEQVCAPDRGSTLDNLGAIVDESLAHREPAAQPRVTMLETVREYACERLHALGEEDGARRRHCDYFLKFAEEAEAASTGPEQSEWFERLELEHDNLRSALSFARAQEGPHVELRFCGALWRFWQTHGHLDEGRRALEAALDSNREGDPLLRARVLNGAGVLAGEQGDFEAAGGFFEPSLQLARELGDHGRIAGALANLGNLALFAGDFARARLLYEESIEESVLGGASATELIARENLGLVALDEGDLGRAVALLEESAALAAAEQDERTRASSTRALAAALLECGELARARSLLGESLTLARRLGELNGIAYCFDTFAGLAAAEGDPREAALLFGAADAVRSSIGALRPPDQQPLYEHWLARTLSQLRPAEYATRYEDGRLLDLEGACQHALQLAHAAAE